MEIKRLDGLLAQKGITIARFAVMLGMSRQTLSKKINCETAWKTDEIAKACEIFDISIQEGISLFLR